MSVEWSDGWGGNGEMNETGHQGMPYGDDEPATVALVQPEPVTLWPRVLAWVVGAIALGLLTGWLESLPVVTR